MDKFILFIIFLAILDASAFRDGEDARAELGQLPYVVRLRLAEALLHQQAPRSSRYRETLCSSNYNVATGVEPIADGGKTGMVFAVLNFPLYLKLHNVNCHSSFKIYCYECCGIMTERRFQSFSIPTEDAAPVVRRSKRISMLPPPQPIAMGPPAAPGPRVHPLEVRSHWSATDQQEHNSLILGILNTANIGMLQKLPGIGPKTAIKLHTQR